MDPNLVLKGSQRLERFSNSLKWSKRHTKSTASTNINKRIQTQNGGNSILSSVHGSIDESLNGTVLELANNSGVASEKNSLSTLELRDCPSKTLNKETMNHFHRRHQYKLTKGQDSSKSINLCSSSYVNEPFGSTKCLPLLAEKSRLTSTTYQSKTACNEFHAAISHNNEKVQTKVSKSEGGTSNKIETMSMIDEVFETFVPAMRATETSSNFFSKLVNLHNSNDTTISILRTEDLIRHLNALQSSFKKFALACKMFKKIPHADQVELLHHNSIMFAMVSNIRTYI